MPNRFLCPKCRGQRTTSCIRCDGCGGTGEIETAPGERKLGDRRVSSPPLE